ncbi:MAG: hypothetical protein HRU20_29580 [Pseudomonadales bacterium]|nr:hypothetical protein [Pseudomonadales bacterium]
MLPVLIVFLSSMTFAETAESTAKQPKNEQFVDQEKALVKMLKEAEKEQKKEKIDQQQELVNNAVNDFIVKDESGKEIICSKEDTIATEVDGEVNYRCRSQDHALGENKGSQRGEGETNQLIDNLLQASNQAEDKTIKLSADQLDKLDEMETTKQQKKAAELEDEALKKQADKEKYGSEKSPQAEIQETPEKDKPSKKPEVEAIDITEIKVEGFIEQTGVFLKTLPIKAYLSLRLNVSNNGTDTEASDGGSRGGLIYANKLENGDQFIAHVEVGANVLDNVDWMINSDASSSEDEKATFNRRLSYLRYGRDDYYAVIGKNWSAYHFIAEMTDRFITVGGKASGIYNAGSDGGATGTGRAENAFQLRSSRGNLQWSFQIQANNNISNLQENVKYALNSGISTKWKSINGFAVGLAFNRAVPERYSNEMLDLGLDGSSDARVLGAEWHNSDWFLSTTFSKNSNHVTDPTGQYYDARGWEFYSSRKFTPRTMGRFGWNIQKPDDDSYIGKHKIQEYYLSWQYSYNRNNLQDKLYIEYLFNQGRDADGSEGKDLIVLGARFNLSN